MTTRKHPETNERITLAGDEFPIDAKLLEITHNLTERVKELNCLYGISRLVEKKSISLFDLMQGVVNLIPPAWQYPDVTCAAIDLRNKQFRTASFKKTKWSQIEKIFVNGKNVGTLAVYYTQEKPFAFEGPFLKEERDLIHGIAERLGHIIESRNAEDKLEKLYRREQKLRQKLQVEIQNRVEFTRLLVHELKTPLTSLVATGQLLTEETQNTRLEKLTGYVMDGANNLNKRINDLHDVIRGEIGKLTVELKPLHIENLLQNMAGELKALAGQYGVVIKLKIKVRRLPAVIADEERIRQILYNLINNACKYASQGKKIDMIAGYDPVSDRVIIEVKDYGPGISKERQRFLFKPGFEVSGQSEKSGGLGIGLALCKMLVELHGGNIWVKSTVGKGSSFFLSLPVVKSNEKH